MSLANLGISGEADSSTILYGVGNENETVTSARMELLEGSQKRGCRQRNSIRAIMLPTTSDN